MIYTVTLNPAIDALLKLNQPLKIGKINRAYFEDIDIGGKGINVSRVLKLFKRESVAMGLVGGSTGESVEKYLRLEGVKTDFAHIKGITRMNAKIINKESGQTEVNGPGPTITREDIVNLAKKLAKIRKEDIVIISGSIPKSFTPNLFDSFVKLIANRGAYIVLDLYGAYLLKTLKYKPFLININEEELSDTFYLQVKNEEVAIRSAKRLLKMGAQNVIVLRGANGAIFVNNESTIKVKAFKGEAKNPIGAGDALLAGFVDEYLKTESFERAIKKGVAVGCAKAFSDYLLDEKLIAKLTKQIK